MQALLTVTGETSAAAAQCARMCALLQASYPDCWPETVRALIVFRLQAHCVGCGGAPSTKTKVSLSPLDTLSIRHPFRTRSC